MPAPARKTDEGAVPVTLTLTGPPGGKFEKGPMISFRGSLDEVIEMTAEFFDNGDIVDDLRATFQLGRATAVVASQLDAEPETSAPTPISKAPSAPAGVTCPECGEGKLREREGKYGKFTGCSAFPNCKYVVKGK